MSLIGTRCHLSSTSPLKRPFSMSITWLSLSNLDSSQKIRSPSSDISGTSSPRRPAPKEASMKTTVSSNSSLALSPIGECHRVSASAQTAIANAEVNASFCLRIIPIFKREPLMKRPNHLPEVCPVVTYCLAQSSPTTVHEYSCPASWALFSHVRVFRIVSYCLCFEFLPMLLTFLPCRGPPPILVLEGVAPARR